MDRSAVGADVPIGPGTSIRPGVPSAPSLQTAQGGPVRVGEGGAPNVRPLIRHGLRRAAFPPQGGRLDKEEFTPP